MYHFGYGSNLNMAFLREYVPSAEFVMVAYLPNYEVQFRFWSKKRQGGISSIIEKPGHLVHGVIYECDEEELKELDILESVPQGLYRRETFKVLGEDKEWYDADLYRVVNPQGPFTPARGYVDLMISGAKDHGLDPDYIQELEAIYERSL
ncbi:MAG: gamma-glutamylcyclotransferase family protein [archaeon]